MWTFPMSEIRYCIAVAFVCLVPGVFVYWFSIHPFVNFWRRVGAGRTVGLHLAFMGLIALIVSTQRSWLIAVEFESHLWLYVAGGGLMALSAVLRKRLGWELRLSTLLGFPEVDPARYPQPLLTGGPYAHVRHPRYLQLTLAFWAWALLANYLAAYVLAALALAGIRLVVHWEERELRTRYGAAYREYELRVPRFIPRFHKQ